PIFSFSSSRPHPLLPSFPTRRSSDLAPLNSERDSSPSTFTGAAGRVVDRRNQFSMGGDGNETRRLCHFRRWRKPGWCCRMAFSQDRKSTRLNSSHSQISYAVFCLKKK